MLLSLPSGIEKSRFDNENLDIDEFNDTPLIQNKQQGIEIVRDAIKSSLRTGDVMTRYSGNQYLVLMRNIYRSEDVDKVIGRIMEKSSNKFKKLGITLEVDFTKI